MKRICIGLKDETHIKAKIISTLKKITLNIYFQNIVKEAIEKDKMLLENNIEEQINKKNEES